HKAKLREQDKARKAKEKQKSQQSDEVNTDAEASGSQASVSKLPWILLAVSWIGFAAYFAL
ncbi:MAG: DUF2956 family protein, partial [Gammaproteobacteria bacterium]|nr:DUF2956 family protein [Gammaproteobacteria bacterium]